MVSWLAWSFVWIGSAAAAPDLTELLPADTLAYAEASRLQDVAPLLAQYTHGTVLTDIVAFIDKHRSKANTDDIGLGHHLGAWGVYAGPEMLAELVLVQGAATALVRYDKDQVPETVAIAHLGSSRLFSFLMRNYLVTNTQLRPVETINGVRLYQEAQPQFVNANAGAFGPPPPPLPPTEYNGPVYAQLPGTLVVGSSRAVVGDVVRRLTGQLGKTSLATLPRFQAAQALRRAPGVFVYADVARWLAAQPAEAGAEETSPEALTRELLRPQSVRTVVAQVNFAAEQLGLTLQLDRVPGQVSPLLELIQAPTGTVPAVPTEGTGVVQIGAPAKGKLWPQLLAIADAVGRAQGVIGRLPSDAAQEAGPASAQLDAACAQVVNLTVLLPDLTGAGKGWPLPTVVCTCQTLASAQALADAVPGLGPIAGAGKVTPITETIAGQRVQSLAGTAFPWRTTLHYGAAGTKCVLGTDAARVARLLANDAPPTPANAAALGVWRWGASLADGLAVLTPKRNSTPNADRPGFGTFGGTIKPDDPKPVLAEIRKRAQNFPPLRVQIRPGADRWELTAQQAFPAAERAALIDGLMDWLVIVGRLQYAITLTER
jgi:hypothetical protein